MRVIEVLIGGSALGIKGKVTAHTSSNIQTEFEKNVRALRGKKHRLSAQKPIKPIKHGP